MSLTTDAYLTGRAAGPHRLLSVPPITALATDLAAIGSSVAVAARLRWTGFLLDESSRVEDLTVVGPLLALAWVILIAVRGGYDHDVFGAGVDEYKRVAGASTAAAALLAIVCYLAEFPLPRGFFLFTFLVGTIVLLGTRYLVRKTLQGARREGYLRKRVLLVGDVASADEIARVLQRESWLGYEVLAALTPASETESQTASGIPILGNADETIDLAPSLGADLVFLTGGGLGSSSKMSYMLHALESEDINVVVAPRVTDMSSERVKVRPVAGLPLIHLGKPRAVGGLSWAKRAFDLTAATTLLLVLSPLLLVAALRIRAHDGGPVLFRQVRVGRSGSSFTCLQFRTMATGAADHLDDLRRPHTNGPFTMVDDPRVTPPGRWLRRYSIDELPQLWNVIRGDMSLVGPRPPLPREVALYDEVASRRLRVRPGMTGLWHVSGRSNLTWDEAIRLDVYYVDNWSMIQDVVILLRTARAVLRRDGGY